MIKYVRGPRAGSAGISAGRSAISLRNGHNHKPRHAKHRVPPGRDGTANAKKQAPTASEPERKVCLALGGDPAASQSVAVKIQEVR